MGYRVAVVGATGNVGREILSILAERQFPIDKIEAIASSQSTGREVSFGDEQTLIVKPLDSFDFEGFDIVFSSVGSKVIRDVAPRVAQAGAILIDNSSAFRRDPDIPLVVPEINREMLHMARRKNIVASPNCIAVPLAVAMKPLTQLAGIKRIVVSTYQATSGAGYDAMDELFRQTRAIFVNDPIVKENFTKQIAFNAIPHIGYFEHEGYTDEEIKISYETQKLLDMKIAITATAVRIPVFISHCLSANVEFDSPVNVQEARQLLQETEGISVIDRWEDEAYVTPAECAGEDDIFISRIRQDFSVDHGLNLWIVGDNLRKGAALNTVHIAEALVEEGIV